MSGVLTRLWPRPCGAQGYPSHRQTGGGGWNTRCAPSGSGGSYFHRHEPRTTLEVGDLRVSVTARMSPQQRRVEALREELYRRWEHLEEDWERNIRRELRSLGDAALPMLMEEMNEQRARSMRFINARAARLLGWTANEKAVQPLCDVLKVGRRRVVEEAINSLLVLDDPMAGVPLLKVLENLRNPTPYIRFPIVCALGKWRVQEAVEPLIEMLVQSRLSHTQQEVIINALANIGDERAIDPLIGKLRCTYEPLVRTASRALVSFGERARAPLERTLQGQDIPFLQRRRVANALADIGK
jgi:hypothetical protein